MYNFVHGNVPEGTFFPQAMPGSAWEGSASSSALGAEAVVAEEDFDVYSAGSAKPLRTLRLKAFYR